jgi:hypothetical protein
MQINEKSEDPPLGNADDGPPLDLPDIATADLTRFTR